MIERELRDLFRPKPRHGGAPVAESRLNIARLDLVFDNAKPIKLLRERGLALYDKDVKKVREIEAELEASKEDLYKGRVCGCFVTLENGLDRVQRVLGSKQGELKINGTVIKIKRAKEPKNYIWENMAYTSQQLFRAKTLVVILFSTVLAVCYKIQYKYQYETTYLGTFEKVDCALYHNSLPSKHYFAESEIEEGDLDADTIAEFKATVNEAAQ